MTLRLLHTADIHIGLSFNLDPEAARGAPDRGSFYLG